SPGASQLQQATCNHVHLKPKPPPLSSRPHQVDTDNATHIAPGKADKSRRDKSDIGTSLPGPSDAHETHPAPRSPRAHEWMAATCHSAPSPDFPLESAIQS